ncbi:DUF177 domain-containing protein [Agrilactobacillus fermenti]|uniref:DUF177 domain-containing protein n=1 Tax=Agrilactobacillus fermenti TaxID=2586909 RepID=UPI001E55438E|nr:DUF177 domain-containing protein [Agrilactobacillus fermenti]MCD2256680.1 DUF177 domain-containing protein [Agrilactobacillus fermenti]
MLQWTLAELAKFQQKPLQFNETLDLKQALHQRLSEISDAQPFTVKGSLTFDHDAWILDMHLVGTITVPSTRSLAPVSLPIDRYVSEVYVTSENADDENFEDEVVIEIEDKKIDLQQSIEDNIILSIPSQVLTPEEKAADIMPKGQGWHVVSEADYQTAQSEEEGTPNPEFEKLKDLFSGQDRKNTD